MTNLQIPRLDLVPANTDLGVYMCINRNASMVPFKMFIIFN